MDRFFFRRLAWGAGLASLGGLLLLPAAVEAPEPTPALVAESYYGSTPAPAAGSVGMRIFLDEDGRPTAPPRDATDIDVIRSTTTRGALVPTGEPAREVDAPGGGKILRLDDRFQTYSVARIAADGSVTVTCERPGTTQSGHGTSE